MHKLLLDLKKWMAALGIALLLTIITSFVSFASTAGDIRQDSFRLHVLANSDSAADQSVKLKVRDRLLQETAVLFAQSANKQETIRIATEGLSKMEQAARAVLREEGVSDVVRVEVCNMYFTTRYYEDYTLPAGDYDALRVSIGKAEGKNWWCVLYPALCLPGAVQQEEADTVYSDAEQEVVENGTRYRYSFALLEWLEGLRASK